MVKDSEGTQLPGKDVELRRLDTAYTGVYPEEVGTPSGQLARNISHSLKASIAHAGRRHLVQALLSTTFCTTRIT